MQRKNIIVMVSFLLIVALTNQTLAFEKLGQAGFKFLDIAVGARPTGMAGAYTMIEGDVNSLFYNPAGISWTDKRIDLMFNKTSWIAGISYNSFGLIYNLKNWGTFGLSALMADYPKSIRTMVADNEQGFVELGEMNASAYAFGLAYSRKITSKFSIGGRISYVGQQLGESLIPIMSAGEEVGQKTVKNKTNSISYDVGTVFYPGFKSFRFGVSIMNFSRQIKYENDEFQLPLTFRLAGAINLMDFIDSSDQYHWLLDVEVLHHRDHSQRVLMGTEFSFKKMFFVRIGYKSNHDIEGLSFGLGVKIKGISIDYSYSPVKYFDQVSRMSIGFSY